MPIDFTLSNLISVLGALSVGALLTSTFQFWADRNKLNRQKREEFKETRYKAIIILMDASLDFNQSAKNLSVHRNFASKEELQNELLTEWRNMLLYANDHVIKSMKAFVKEPNEQNFYKTGIAMRRDLYGIKTGLTIDDLT